MVRSQHTHSIPYITLQAVNIGMGPCHSVHIKQRQERNRMNANNIAMSDCASSFAEVNKLLMLRLFSPLRMKFGKQLRHLVLSRIYGHLQ